MREQLCSSKNSRGQDENAVDPGPSCWDTFRFPAGPRCKIAGKPPNLFTYVENGRIYDGASWRAGRAEIKVGDLHFRMNK